MVPSSTSRLALAHIQVGQDLRILLVLSQDRMARRAVLGDRARAVAGGLVVVVVAAEAAEEILVADVVRMRAPGELHLRKHVPLVDGLELPGGRLDLGA